MVPRLVSLSAVDAAEGEPLPDRFRIFRAGWNDSTKGKVLFDEKAAAMVLARYRKHGVDLMLDRNHDSIDPATMVARSDAADAQAWFGLDVVDGELWGVGVRWTPEGEERVRSRKQRYISPAFRVDKHGRVIEVVNAALVAMPATHDAQPLIAASEGGLGGTMDPKLIEAAIAAIEAQDGTAALDVLKQLVTAAAGGEPADDPSDEPAAPAPDEPAAASAVDRTVVLDAFDARLSVIESRQTAADLERKRALVGELVKLGAEPIAEAWADPAKRTLSPRYAGMAVADLEARVSAWRDHARTLSVSAPLRSAGADPLESFSEVERATLAKIKDKDARDRFIAIRLSRREGI